MTEFPSFERFKAWLARKPADAVLAEKWDADTCPLCIFLAEHGAIAPAVSPKEWADIKSVWRPLPNWAREFVYWVDKIKPRSVTPAELVFVMELPGWNPQRWDQQFEF